MSSFTSPRYRVHNDHQALELMGQHVKHQADVPSGEGDEEVDPYSIDYNYVHHVLKKKLKIQITNLTAEEINFDLIGVDASIANAIRRIMMAEVPTIAIETVWIGVNTSIIQDEVLAHRVGLIPIKADPRKLEYVVGDEETDKDTIVFHFDAECTFREGGGGADDMELDAGSASGSASGRTFDDSASRYQQQQGDIDRRSVKSGRTSSKNSDFGSRRSRRGSSKYIGESAQSGLLQWLPQGTQQDDFEDGVEPVHKDIVVAKLRPGQRIEFEAHCRKGVGKDHAKFSPVATASYRLLPEISFSEPITGDAAIELQNMCPMQVFDIEDLPLPGSKSSSSSLKTGDIGSRRVPTAVVARPRDCTMCRECVRREGWAERVELRRVSDHFLYSVESTGCIPPEQIVRDAFSILKEKAEKFRDLIDEHAANSA